MAEQQTLNAEILPGKTAEQNERHANEGPRGPLWATGHQH